jgi:hypothetical protein
VSDKLSWGNRVEYTVRSGDGGGDARFPFTTNVFSESGEKFPAITSPSESAVAVEVAVSNTNELLGLLVVSEINTLLPSFETAITFPGRLGWRVIAGGVAAVFTMINPLSLPRYAFFPWGSNSIEFGTAGRLMAVPIVFPGVAIGTMLVVQPGLPVHPLLVAQTLNVAGAPLTTTVRTLFAYTGFKLVLHEGGVQLATMLVTPGCAALMSPAGPTDATPGWVDV